MLPSPPPVERREEWMGCQVRVEISFASLPRSRQMSRIMRRSKTRAVWSRPQVARSWPFMGSNFVRARVFLWPWKVVRQRPVRGSHSLTWWSLDPETISPLLGCQSTDFTSQP